MFGDSLSSEPGSWAEIVDYTTPIHVRNAAVRGLRMIDFAVPRWLSCHTNPDRNIVVVIWLGTNDAGRGEDVGLYQRYLTDALQFLAGRDCTVILIEPPLELPNTQEYARITRTLAEKYDNVSNWRLSHPVDLTRDGLHQTEALYTLQAIEFIQRWELRGQTRSPTNN